MSLVGRQSDGVALARDTGGRPCDTRRKRRDIGRDARDGDKAARGTGGERRDIGKEVRDPDMAACNGVEIARNGDIDGRGKGRVWRGSGNLGRDE